MADDMMTTVGEDELRSQTSHVVEDMIATNDVDKVKDLTHLFNLLQAKKNAIRMIKMGELVDMTTEQMAKRLYNKPDEFTNKELSEYLSSIQTAMDKVSRGLGTVDDMPMIALQQNNVTVSVGSGISPDSRERITDAVKAIFARQNQQSSESTDVVVTDTMEGCRDDYVDSDKEKI